MDATTPEEVERQIATDPDLAVPEDWAERLIPGLAFPLPRENKRPVHIRLDPEVLAYFKAQGRGWQTRINVVLRSFVERQQRRSRWRNVASLPPHSRGQGPAREGEDGRVVPLGG